MIVHVLRTLVVVPVVMGVLMLVRVLRRPVRMLVCVSMHMFVLMLGFHVVPPGGPSGHSATRSLPPAEAVLRFDSIRMLSWMPMSELSRIGVAISTDLLGTFDDLIAKRGYTNRSEAFRDLIRAELVRETSTTWPGGKVVGTLTLVYDHHVRLLEEKMTDLQHDHHRLILSTLHVHLDHDRCMEVIALKGSSAEIQRFGNLMGSIKGVKHAQLAITAAADAHAGTD